MNILPKKSWHVRNKDNVAKVRKDEEEARQKEKLRLQQISFAEQEARTALLRKQARKSLVDEATGSDIVAVREESINRPINFFQNIGPDGKPYDVSAKNTEHEKELQQEKEKAEKKIGLLTYLGQSAVETMKDEERPWYFKAPCRDDNASDNRTNKVKIADSKRKASLDPLMDMKEHLHKKKKHKSHKKKTKQRSSSSTKGLSADDKMAKLRKARLEREAREKQRSLNLLQKHYGVVDDKASRTSSDQFKQKYSNQFNPHLARNNR